MDQMMQFLITRNDIAVHMNRPNYYIIKCFQYYGMYSFSRRFQLSPSSSHLIYPHNLLGVLLMNKNMSQYSET